MRTTLFQRRMLLFRYLTLLIFGCFVMATFYNIQYVQDDGSCPMFTTMAACLQKTLPFNSRQTKFEWEASGYSWSNITTSPVLLKCVFNSPKYELWQFLLFSVLVSLISIPVQLVLFSLFDGVILAPTSSDITSHHNGSSNRRTHGAATLIEQSDVMEAQRLQQAVTGWFSSYIGAPQDVSMARHEMEINLRKHCKMK